MSKYLSVKYLLIGFVCVFGFKGIAYFDALVIDLEEVAVFSCDMTSLGKQINMMMMMMMISKKTSTLA